MLDEMTHVKKRIAVELDVRRITFFTGAHSVTHLFEPIMFTSTSLKVVNLLHCQPAQSCPSEMKTESSESAPKALPKSSNFKLMLMQLRSRERKRFNQLSLSSPSGVPMSARMMFQLEWSITIEDVEVLLNYWNHQSALRKCAGLSNVISECRAAASSGVVPSNLSRANQLPDCHETT